MDDITISSCKLLHGDCTERMKELQDASIDMILCDLPYGTTRNKWDVVIPFNLLWKEYERVIKDNGAIILFSAEPFTSELIMSNRTLFRYDLIWRKTQGSDFLNANRKPMRIHENICIFSKKQTVYNPQMKNGEPYINKASSKGNGNYDSFNMLPPRQNEGTRYPITVIDFDSQPHTGIIHPTQKPTSILEYLIKTYSNKGDVILDNCMGSCSTGIACINTNRKFIGIEKNDEYFTASVKRIKDYVYEQSDILPFMAEENETV